jgi:hypothetical protein
MKTNQICKDCHVPRWAGAPAGLAVSGRDALRMLRQPGLRNRTSVKDFSVKDITK